jgi:hypothetical protein
MPSQLSTVCFAALLCWRFSPVAFGFSAPVVVESIGIRSKSTSLLWSLHEHEHEHGTFVETARRSRRDALVVVGLLAVSGVWWPTHASAAQGNDDNDDNTTLWLTGKAPKVPGQKPKDKSDVSGTKRDPNFLRSISDCKSQCENTPGPGGLARSKEDCLSECQDICCTTYEQCTFAIVPRI